MQCVMSPEYSSRKHSYAEGVTTVVGVVEIHSAHKQYLTDLPQMWLATPIQDPQLS